MNRIQFAAALLMVNGTVAAAAGFDESVKAMLEARYREMKTAMAARDTASVRAFLASGFVSEDASGKKEDADTMLRDLAALPKDPNKVSDTVVLSVERVGDTTVAVQRYHMTTTKSGKDGSPQQVELVTTSRDTWKLTEAGSWLLTSTITQRLDYSVNGKLVVHKEHPSQ